MIEIPRLPRGLLVRTETGLVWFTHLGRLLVCREAPWRQKLIPVEIRRLEIGKGLRYLPQVEGRGEVWTGRVTEISLTADPRAKSCPRYREPAPEFAALEPDIS